MGIERYEMFVRAADGTLTYPPGWALDNRTGAWRSTRPLKDAQRCNDCGICWLYCPEGCITHGTHEIDYEYCKGCGICVTECRRGALRLEREGE